MVSVIKNDGSGNATAGNDLNMPVTHNHYYQTALPIETTATIEPAKFKRQQNNLPDDTPHFTGRVKELEAVKTALQSGNAIITPISAEAGVGKTTLAKHIAHTMIPDFDIVWFVNAQSASTANSDFASLAAQFGRVFHETENIDVRAFSS